MLDERVRIDLPLEEALRMGSLYPATLLGMEHQLGRLIEGYQADIIAFDQEFTLHHSWIGGQLKSYR